MGDISQGIKQSSSLLISNKISENLKIAQKMGRVHGNSALYWLSWEKGANHG